MNPTEAQHPGITDEAAIEGHDLIHNAEVEEQKAHGDAALTQPDYGEGEGEGVGGQSKSKSKTQKQQQGHHDKSTLEKVKEALHIHKK